MDSSAPEAILATDFRLALKAFMNKEFDRSFPLIQRLCDQAFHSLEKGYVGEELVTKIVVLYLTELGLMLCPKDSHGAYVLPRKEKQRLVDDLKSGRTMAQICSAFGGVVDVPSKVLYQVHLVYYTCQELLCTEDPKFVKRQFEKTYASLNFKGADDVYLQRLVEMYVCNVLPSEDEYATAYAIVQSNPLLDTEVYTKRLQETEKVAQQQKKADKQKKKECQLREQKLAEEERERQRKEQEEKSLKYKSLKQIKQETEMARGDRYTPPTSRSSSVAASDLKQKLLYYYKLTHGLVQKNFPVIATVIILVLALLRVVNVKKINLRDTIKETLLMAMKVTYL